LGNSTPKSHSKHSLLIINFSIVISLNILRLSLRRNEIGQENMDFKDFGEANWNAFI